MTTGLANVGGNVVLVREGRFLPLTHWGETRDLPALLEDWDAVLPQILSHAADAGAFADAPMLADADLRAPYRPGQIFCTGANYKKHVVGLVMGEHAHRHAADQAGEELSEEERRARIEAMMDARAKADPYCFVKLSSCVTGPNDPVILPRNVARPDWELELGVVIGRRARHVTVEEAMDHVAGYVIVNDVTARDLVFRRDVGGLGADWLSGKCFPTFLPFGPLIVPRQLVADPYALTIRLAVNGQVYQDESTADMMVGIDRQIAFLSSRVELMPGDVICTGSPYGNGAAFGVFLKPGDVMEGSITGLGSQRNPCVAEA